MGRIRGWRHGDEAGQMPLPVAAAPEAVQQAEALLRKWGGWSGDRLGHLGGFTRDERTPRAVQACVMARGFVPRYQVILLGKYVRGLSPAEICRQAGIAAHTYNDWLARALAYFAERWAARHMRVERLTDKPQST